MNPKLYIKLFFQRFVVFVCCLQLFFQCDFITLDEDKENKLGTETPNFIIIIVDDLRYDALGYFQNNIAVEGRFPGLETPTLDSLIGNGTYFTHAFTTTSLCSPSRASILTGRYASEHEIKDNSTAFKKNSFVSILQDIGYQTAIFGKWHMGNQKPPFRGFDYSYTFKGQGGVLDAVFNNGQRLFLTKGWVDEESTNALIDFLNTQNTQDPFCYILSYKSVHGPWNYAPQDFDGKYANMRFGKTSNSYHPPPYPDVLYDSIDYPKTFNHQDKKYLEMLSGLDNQMNRLVQSQKK